MTTNTLSAHERLIWKCGSLLMVTAIILGAFGAHGLKKIASPEALAWWETGATYHRTHGLGVMLIAALWPRVSISRQKWLKRAIWCHLSGVFLFSGSLYIMTLTEMKWLGAITPFGGTLFILGWLSAFMAVVSKRSSS